MSRNKKPLHLKRTKDVRVYVTASQYQAIKNAARTAGQEISEWAREKLVQQASAQV